MADNKMPENPGLPKGSLDNYLYFTSPMSLNYQRNSYVLWECAYKSFLDSDTKDIFYPTKYKVALQPNKQPVIWRTLCNTFMTKYEDDLQRLFYENGYSVKRLRIILLIIRRIFLI